MHIIVVVDIKNIIIIIIIISVIRRTATTQQQVVKYESFSIVVLGIKYFITDVYVLHTLPFLPNTLGGPSCCSATVASVIVMILAHLQP